MLTADLDCVRSTSADAKRDQRETAATICFNLAEFYQESKQTEKAISFYDEALKHNEGHEKSRLVRALAIARRVLLTDRAFAARR